MNQGLSTPPKKRRIGLAVLLTAVCVVTLAVFIAAAVFVAQGALTWSGLMSNRPSAEERASDPLSIEDVSEELKHIPRPAAEFCAAVRVKQLYFKDYLSDWRDGVARRPDTVRAVVAGKAKTKGTSVTWARGAGPSDVVGLLTLISWSGYSSGARGLMVTCDWTLYLDDQDAIIGYAMHEYPPHP